MRRRRIISPDGSAEIDGLTLVADVNEQFGLHIDEDTYTTVGGYVSAGWAAGRASATRSRSPGAQMRVDGARRPAGGEGVAVDAVKRTYTADTRTTRRH